MKSIIFLAIFLCMISYSHAIKTKVEGKVPGAENLDLRFYVWDDFITFKETLLMNVPINSKGEFEFEIDLHKNEVLTGFFRIMNFQSPEIYLEAGKEYDLDFDTFDYKDPNRIFIPHMTNLEISYHINNIDSTSVNFLIQMFNIDYNMFIVNELNLKPDIRSQIMYRLPKSKVDSFVNTQELKYKNFNNDFFKTYMNYTFAEMHLGFRTCGIETIYRDYIYKKPIQYDNIQYMSFFTQFYSDFIFSVSTKINGRAILRIINSKPDLNGIIDSLGRDTLLKNELIREAVLVLNMKEWYSNPYFSKENLILLMQEYIKNTKFDLQARIVKNLVFLLTRYQKGNLMPEFSFKNIDGPEYNNDSLIGKTSYILFFSTWCKSCWGELEVMEKLFHEWSDSINFIAVNMDNEPLKLYYFLDEHSFSFPVYHFDNDYILAEELSLESYPHSMLIDKEGKYIMYNAYLPSEGIHDYFKLMFAPPVEKEIEIGN
ncbi:MAG: TlpA family protein disulfide reductase [Bacteroidales bacterium]|nr:TlpA family protein disulfide reductase [Bacteroidales bacterium]